MLSPTATITPRVLAFAALLAVGTQTLCQGVDGHHGSTGGYRYPRLDKFLHDRMGLDNRSALIIDRNLMARTAISTTTSTTTVASVVAPEDEDYDGSDDEDDEKEDEEMARESIRLRHLNRRENDNDLSDKNVQNHEPTKTMSPMSEIKWKLLGSKKAVEETFRNPRRISMLQGDNENAEAYKHQMRMLKEASCKVPRPRVVKVSDVYPSSNKKYIPSCTVLHVCADDTGCCNSPTLKCGPKISQPIYLYFLVYTIPVLGDNQSPEQMSNQKSLLFYNHTECECQSKMDDEMPRDSLPTAAVVFAERPSVVHRTDNCKCPTEYTIRYLANGSCSCDCFDKQRECIRYKKGNMYFNHMDRYCITSGQCLLPMCEYGVYSHRKGRCPKKFDNFHTYKKKHYF